MMASTENTTGTGGANHVIGKVSILYGTVKAISPDGTVRILAPNSPVYANDQIITESDGSVAIMLDGPPPAQLNLGRMTTIILDEDVYAGVTPAMISDAAAEAEQIQKELLSGDQPIELEATAAGGVASAGGGHPVVKFELTGDEVTPTSGAETIGIIQPPIEPIEGNAEEPRSGLVDHLPEIGPEAGTVYESALDGGSGGGTVTATGTLDITSLDGVAAVRVGGVLVPVGGTTGPIAGAHGGQLVVTESGWCLHLDIYAFEQHCS
jgi:hypothetical protein